MSITEFLLARLDEDEAVARLTIDNREGVPEPYNGYSFDDEYYLLRVATARVLADVAAKRAIVEAARRLGLATFEESAFALGALMTLAQPYADHPDYDEAWRP